jgi:hypothetical protein
MMALRSGPVSSRLGLQCPAAKKTPGDRLDQPGLPQPTLIPVWPDDLHATESSVAAASPRAIRSPVPRGGRPYGSRGRVRKTSGTHLGEAHGVTHGECATCRTR